MTLTAGLSKAVCYVCQQEKVRYQGGLMQINLPKPNNLVWICNECLRDGTIP